MPLVYLKLTKAQASNLAKGKGARITPETTTTHMMYAVDMDPSVYKRYSKSLLSGKGCIVKGDIMEVDGEVEGGKIRWKKMLGVGAEKLKKAIPEKVAKQIAEKGVTGAVLAGSTFIGMPNPKVAEMAGKFAGNATGAAYDTDFRKKDGLKQFGKNFVDESKDDIIKEATANVLGGALDLKKLKKNAKRVANKVAPVIQKAKQYVPKDELKEAVKRNAKTIALKLSKDEALAEQLSQYADKVTDVAYDQDLTDRDAGIKMGRQLRDTKRDAEYKARQYAQDQIRRKLNNGGEEQIDGGLLMSDGRSNAIKSELKLRKSRGSTAKGVVTNLEGQPVSRAKFVKGSPEAKAYMASLRARRKGAGLVQSRVASIESMTQGKGMVPLGGRGMVPLGGRGMVPL